MQQRSLINTIGCPNSKGALHLGVPRKRIEYQYDSESRRIARAELAWSGIGQCIASCEYDAFGQQTVVANRVALLNQSATKDKITVRSFFR